MRSNKILRIICKLKSKIFVINTYKYTILILKMFLILKLIIYLCIYLSFNKYNTL